jgi:hypothetical protein
MTNLSDLKEKLSVFEVNESPHAGFILGQRTQHAKDLKTILRLLEIIEVQRECLDSYANMGGYYDRPEEAQEALTKTDEMLGEL